MNLQEVHRGVRKHKKRKRLGRGVGTGQGKTAGRGHKGQKSRAGYKALSIFEGGTMPLVRRVPKRGFTNSFALTVATVNVGDLERIFEAGQEVTPQTLRERSLVKSRYDILKVLGDGELTKQLNVSAHRFSKSAEEKIKQAGGQTTVLPGRTPTRRTKKDQSQAEQQSS